MRIAMLVLAHKNLEQLRSLCERLGPDFEVFVHIDAKTPFGPADLTDIPNVHAFKIHRVSWGSLAMVRATLDLLKLAAPFGFQRFVLISGQDHPIKTNEEILDFYKRHPNINFVQALNLRDWDRGGLERVTHWHIRSPLGTTGLMRLALEVVGAALSKLQYLSRYSRTLPWEFYCGPQWIDITAETASAILALVETRPEFLSRFKGTTCADEIFFQTAINLLGLQGTCSPAQTRYIDWTSGPEYPRTLCLEDLQNLRSSPALFARKFDANVDPAILDALKQ